MAHIEMRSVRNMHDLGGLSGACGTVRPGLLLRSAHLARLGKRDAAMLRERYGLKLVIDLRTSNECRERPDAPIEGVEYRHMPVFEGMAPGISHDRASDSSTRASRIPDMRRMYRGLVRGECVGHLAQTVGLIVDEAGEGAILFHCTEGKDRTGIVSLILLSILGVSDKLILADYLSTNDTARRRARNISWMVRILKRDPQAADNLAAVFVADKAYLRSAVGAINEDWGGMDAFVHDGLGVSEKRCAAFRQRLIVG